MSELVEVLYNYDYNTAEGRHIVIHRGDVFNLLAKSTSEWWKVRRGANDKFYVPATYVKVITSGNTEPYPKPQTPLNSETSLHISTDIPAILQNGHDPSDQSENSSSMTSSLRSNGDHAPASNGDNNVEYVNREMLKLDLDRSLSAPSVSKPTYLLLLTVFTLILVSVTYTHPTDCLLCYCGCTEWPFGLVILIPSRTSVSCIGPGYLIHHFLSRLCSTITISKLY